ncbi:DUF6470 family protein [Cohnella sp. AR92]|uniref:DUF6470 family protein n=1 Tax=Cohnella sp. AR92 TaxID=648716 RepID=UPI000F8DD5D9|nr:DUF6470 family protein [Cohnella sp. AR92]RUS42590.1 hypothetical protein ELR57_26435 [Cohnella sp. AR92]
MIPQISISSQRGLIGIDSEPGRYEIRTFRPQLEVETTKPQMTAHTAPGTLNIDNSDTQNALTGGKPVVFWERIYSQYKQVVQQNIQRIVDEGNQMGDLRIKRNPIPDMALNEFIEGGPDLQVYGFASPRNVHFEYVPNELNLEITPGDVKITPHIQKPEINFRRGSVDIYMQQYPKVTITPPQVDITV